LSLLKLHITHLSDKGLVRATNQDAYSVDLLDPRGNAALLIIADGMGGYEGGEIASALAVETVRTQVCANAADWAERGWLGGGLIESINQANQAIVDKQAERPELSHMGTTITAALIWGGRIVIGHIGDSRAFFVGKKGARQVTTDHNVAGEMVQGGHLTADQAAVHPQRHYLTRALGIGEQIVVERHDLPWQNKELLVLSTDGLSGLVSLQEVAHLAQQTDFTDLAAQLVELAKSRGGNDNITVLIARWEG